ncbi:MAG: SusD/RagB family nutrient-binding outer membrane lipoprotein, partial [Bacteroidia bacterium]|nr:SusD/RagB family nutrient-binding outer membrane lipoprotein [Bacteroidia bacterium]
SQDAANVTAIHPNTTFNNLVNNYVNLVKTQYDQAATPKDKMRVIAREYWLALYGNGLEAYNLYRRTGQPDRMQPGLIPEFGNFPRTYYYPSAFVNRNRNVDQREITERVFWDTNPAGNSWVY